MDLIRVDANGFYIEPVTVTNEIEITEFLVEPWDVENEVFYTPRFDFESKQWLEGATPEEIEAILNAPKPMTELELLKKQETDLAFELMIKGVL